MNIRIAGDLSVTGSASGIEIDGVDLGQIILGWLDRMPAAGERFLITIEKARNMSDEEVAKLTRGRSNRIEPLTRADVVSEGGDQAGRQAVGQIAEAMAFAVSWHTSGVRLDTHERYREALRATRLHARQYERIARFYLGLDRP